MREKTISLAGQSITLSLAWQAMASITKNVVDPVALLREAMKEKEALDAGLEYEPKVAFDVEAMVRILHFGQVGSDFTVDQIGEMAMDQGVVDVQFIVGEYLAEMVSGDSKYASKEDVAEPAAGKKKARKK
jgi:hypothetical protein